MVDSMGSDIEPYCSHLPMSMPPSLVLRDLFKCGKEKALVSPVPKQNPAKSNTQLMLIGEGKEGS